MLSTVGIAWQVWRVCEGNGADFCLLSQECALALVGVDSHSMIRASLCLPHKPSLHWTLILTLLAKPLVLLPQTP